MSLYSVADADSPNHDLNWIGAFVSNVGYPTGDQDFGRANNARVTNYMSVLDWNQPIHVLASNRQEIAPLTLGLRDAKIRMCHSPPSGMMCPGALAAAAPCYRQGRKLATRGFHDSDILRSRESARGSSAGVTAPDKEAIPPAQVLDEDGITSTWHESRHRLSLHPHSCAFLTRPSIRPVWFAE
jgi:hypothetical protein